MIKLHIRQLRLEIEHQKGFFFSVIKMTVTYSCLECATERTCTFGEHQPAPTEILCQPPCKGTMTALDEKTVAHFEPPTPANSNPHR